MIRKMYNIYVNFHKKWSVNTDWSRQGRFLEWRCEGRGKLKLVEFCLDLRETYINRAA